MNSSVEIYQEKGILSPVRLWSPAEIAPFQAAFLETEAHFTPRRERYDNPHIYFDWARRLATDPKLISLITSVIGPEVIIFGSLILSKLPGKGSNLAWHQDGHFFPEYGQTPYVTAWIALTPSHPRNGCMRVLPGSHHDGIQNHSHSDDPFNLINQKEEIRIAPGQDAVMEVELEPGELSLHHGGLIHQSQPNTSHAPRVGFIVRFVGANLQQSRHAVLRVAGDQPISHLELVQDAVPTDISAGVAAFRQHGRHL